MADYDSGIASGGTLFSDNGQSNRTNNKSATAEQQRKLLEASTSGNLPVIQQLIEECHVKPVSCREDNLHRDTLLHVAAFHGRLNVVKYLIEKVIYDVECRNRFENTPLHRAARQGQLDVVKYLIEKEKSDPMCVCNWNRTPLHHACKRGRVEVVKYLMENERVGVFAKENRYGCTALDLAAESGQLEVVQYMIEEKKCHEDQKEGFNTPLHQAAFGGKLEVVKYLITNKVYDPMCKGWRNRTPLHSACKKNQLEIVKYYMDTCKFKIDSSCHDIHGLNPLDMAARHGALRVVKYMVEEKRCAVTHDTESQYSAIHHAAYGGKVETVRFFVEGGYCDAECPGLKGRTPLHSACRNGMVDVVDYLIEECKVKAMVQDERSGATPLHTAAMFGHKSVVKRLIIEYGCDHYVMDKLKKIPRDYAKDENIITFLSHVEKAASDSLSTTLKEGLKMDIKKPKPTGVELGKGMYGSVVELEVDGEKVAGKVFKWSTSVTSKAQRKKLCDEINMVLRLRHPNIVSSKGVCFLPVSVLPVLLMERLMSTLHDYLVDSANSNLSTHLKVSFLHDVVNGLNYLHNHTPVIIHQDLSAKNVLLDPDLRAKISDFGNAQIVEIGKTTETTECQAGPQRDTSIDILSFGQLALFTVLQEPVQLQRQNYHDSTGKLFQQSDEERQEEYIMKAEQQLSQHQPILVMIKQCLSTSNRPHTGDLLKKLEPLTLTPIRGVDIVAETAVELIPGQSLDFHWIEHGLKLFIPADALTLDTPAPEPITMTIRASINGQFLLPPGLQLVSGIYWVSFSRHFSKPVTLSVQHCCNLEDPKQVSSLCFVAAKCTQKELPYNFKKMTEKCTFSTESCYGTIELKHFSGVGIGQCPQCPQKEQIARSRWNKRYRAQVYSIARVKGSTFVNNVHIPVVWDMDLYKKIVKDYYKKEGAEDGPHTKVNIISDELSFGIGQPPKGWVITPLVPPKLLCKDIDSYNAGTEISTFQMDFSWEGAGPPKTLHHNIFMSGVEPAGSFLNISIYPNIPSTSTLPESANYTGRKRRQETGDAAAEKKLKDCKPDMNSLMYLSTEDGVLKIVEESAIKYRQIGFILLKDKGGSRVNTLTESNPVGAVREIYNHWITEDEDYSWSKLAQCLRECELNVLAHKIEKHFGLTPPQQGQEGTSTNAQRKRTRSKQERTDDTKKRKKS